MAPRKEKKIKDEVGIKPEDGDEDVKTKRPARAKKPTKKAKEADEEAMADDSGDDFDPAAEGSGDDDDEDLEDDGVEEEDDGAGDEEDEEDEEDLVAEDDGYRGKKAPAKKAPPPKKKPASRKRKAGDEDEGDEEEDEGEGGKKKAAAKKRKTVEKVDLIAQAKEAKQAAAAERERFFAKPKNRPKDPVVLYDGWTAHPPSLLYKNWDSRNSEKIAAFDFDGTLVINKSGLEYPKDENDWLPYNGNVYSKLRSYHEQGYKIVIFSNAGNVKGNLDGAASDIRRGRVSHFQAAARVPLVALLATDVDGFRKPGTRMWDFMCDHLNGGVKPKIDQSFFVGDSIDGGDEGFARALGLAYRDEKQEFGGLSREAGSVVDAAAADAAGPSGTGQGLNPELVSIFRRLAELAKSDPKPFKRIAMSKVADTLELFDKRITNDPKILKEVNNLKGVGKGSMATIKEYLETGDVAELHGNKSLPAGKVQKEALEDAGHKDAMKFM